MRQEITTIVALLTFSFFGCKEHAEPVPLATPVQADQAGGLNTKKVVVTNNPGQWQNPGPPLTDMERALSGTWVATVDARASHTGMFSGKVALATNPAKTNAIDSAMDALDKNEQLSTNCIWLELYPDRTGYRFECIIISGEASAIDKVQVNPITGAKTENGAAFTWDFEDQKTMKMKFVTSLLLPGTNSEEHKFSQWNLKIQRQKGDKIEMSESFPELSFDPKLEYGWEVISNTYLP